MVTISDAAWHVAPSIFAWAAEPVLDETLWERPVLETLYAVVAACGDRVALEDREQSITFRGLWDATARLAGGLGGAAGPVGILLPPGPGWSIAMLACLAAGRPCVPLDVAQPLARTLELVAQTGVGLLILPPGETAPDGLAGVCVEAGASVRHDGPLRGGLGLDDPALILCTSGSTGRPKAIVHSQRAMMRKAWVRMNGCGARPGELCLSLAAPATISGALAILSCAVAGVGLRFLDLRREGIAGLIETLTGRPVVQLRVAPSALRMIAALPEAADILKGLRSVTLMSEPVLRADVAVWRACLPAGAILYSVYSSTESGTIAGYPSADDDLDPVRTPAGRLLPGTDAVILDDDGAPCPAGLAGELVLRSPDNALGEWHDGACRAGALLPDSKDATLRIHHTGDIAWRTEDGVYVVLGRKDRMLKINGQRIEPGEIEAALRACDGVGDAAVVSPNGRTIVAFVALAPGVAADGPRAALRTRLPASMLPSRIVPLAVLPRLPGGKVDLVRLTAMAKGPAAG